MLRLALALTVTFVAIAPADEPAKISVELSGDRIHVWVKGERASVAVKSVEVTGREAQVYNLVLGDPVLFVADGFLARSKPPAPASIAP